MFYSPSLNIFVNPALKDDYINANSWPDDALAVSDDVYNEFAINTPPDDKIRVAGKNGLSTWALIPPPSHEELIQQAETERQLLLNQANEYMNSKQWPGKAAIGRLKGEELALYNLWLDYLDALELVDTSSAPDIEWPTPPVTQAS
ncbi:tail fiber assembly protein [Cronobacter sakazakii]|uniref:tail fiber assembly protein n=1 Tax=Cronobacter sakazakii TaxID=28141 RepID=UPI000576C6B8|nr:tail fiber assembly protein [Cronobacter sakazakii]EKK3990359.1 tail fiber assembly protein [Cronobacter sakazakii]EKK4070282.1 tail fiber assembly protein [Cronobacter sakazakii]ELY4107964.1 tail fiber assembly protein [Cronobacter sakazakii]